MTRTITAMCALLVLAATATASGPGGVRIKDITELEGARSNQLVGFGLVVGLDSTGSKSSFTQQVAVDMLTRFNVVTKTIAGDKGDSVFKSGNISAVILTAELGPFARRGSKIDVTVSALDDATSLQGGTLIMTPLRGADHCDYAVAQGPILLGGFSFSAGGTAKAPAATAQKNHPTVGRIDGGAIVEREARGEILCNGQIRLLLRQPDYATSRGIAKAINSMCPNSAVTLDAGSIQVFVPKAACNNLVSFVSDIGALEVTPDVPARVIINERTGTIVAGDQVKIATVALAHGNLAIVTSDEPIASQPLPFSYGKTTILPRGQVNVTEQGGTVQVLPRSVTVAELARALNALGATPRDLIIIFQALKKQGALYAELEIM
ncbi:MAG TPA: flagellar basal body P-ring protein FlgI [Gemmataceae bacterium]|nr:flagellar basal body P-ring protein FlgI [Gemmataceae bacterium]